MKDSCVDHCSLQFNRGLQEMQRSGVEHWSWQRVFGLLCRRSVGVLEHLEFSFFGKKLNFSFSEIGTGHMSKSASRRATR